MVHALFRGDDSHRQTRHLSKDQRFPQGVFTAEQANEMLPLVRAIVSEAVKLRDSIATQQQQIRGIEQLPATCPRPEYRDEVYDIRATIEKDQRQLRACFSELASLGVKPHDPFDGGVDFPSMINRRDAKLCWRQGEAKVSFYHSGGSRVPLTN